MEPYKERMVQEYVQLKERYEKLKDFCTKIEAANITETEAPKHDCPLDLLRHQQSVMGEYLHVLELRMHIEGISLNSGPWVSATYGYICERMQEASIDIKAAKPATNCTGDGDSFKSHLLHYLINKGFKYIAEDANGEFYVYKIKPIKGTATWIAKEQDGIAYIDGIFVRLFTGLKCGVNDEPVELTKLLEE